MSVEDTDVVDAIGVEQPTGKVILTISDHLDWARSRDHLQILQEKINTYVRFVESRELLSTYPDARGRVPVVEIVGRFCLSQAGEDFLARAIEVLAGAGIELRFKVLEA
jgi:hypothetical protein